MLEIKINNRSKSSNVDFPKLMISTNGTNTVIGTNTVMLATKIQNNSIAGTVVYSENSRNIGNYSEYWRLDLFEDYVGEIVLSNKEC